MADTGAQRAIIVLSSGRAGTSLLTQALAAMGMTLSEKLIEASYSNPDGFFEDAEIVEIHKALQTALGGTLRLPLPADWMESEEVKKFRPRLRAVLQRELARTPTIWGFKDPRTCAFLPLWLRMLNAENVNPAFILAVRDPASVARSLSRTTDISPELAELIWLNRNCDALHHTAGDCFVAHYEDWFARPLELAGELKQYTGLDRHFHGDLQEALSPIVKPNLNRAVHEPYVVRNEHVLRLYEALKTCRGADFDRARLMKCVQDCRQAMEGFRGWSDEALRLTQELARGAKSNQESRARMAQVKQLTEDLAEAQQTLRKAQARASTAEGELAREQQKLRDCESRSGVLEAQAKEAVATADALRAERGRFLADLEGAELRHNAYLQQINALHSKVEELSIKRFASPPDQPPAKPEVKKQGLPPTPPPREAPRLAWAPNRAAKPAGLSRHARLWRKLKADPHGYFADSRIAAVRPLRHLFKAR